MRWAYNLCGAGEAIVRDLPTTAALEKGALVMAGTTTGMAGLIIGTAPYVNCLGITDEKQTGTGSISSGTQVYTKVIVDIGAVYRAYFNQTASTSYALAVSSATATSITVSTADDNFDGGYVYIFSGTGIGQLQYVTAASTTVYTVNTMATTCATGDYIHLIPGGFGPADGGTAAVGNNLDLDSTSVYAISDETATGQFGLLEKFINYDGIGETELRYALHDGLTGLDTKNVELSINIIPGSHQYGRPTELS